jgi:hypothetical protein
MAASQAPGRRQLEQHLAQIKPRGVSRGRIR